MIKWLSKKRRSKPSPLTGAPGNRRQKTYSSQTGYIYEYYYEGYSSRDRDGDAGTEYIFNVSANRSTPIPVSVFLSSEAVRIWEDRRGRELNSTECYAVAKLALFQAFDERANPAQIRYEIRVRPADIDVILAKLGIV